MMLNVAEGGFSMPESRWVDMTREQKIAVWDMLEAEMRTLARSIEEQFNEMFETVEMPLKVVATIKMIPDGKGDDPRLG